MTILQIIIGFLFLPFALTQRHMRERRKHSTASARKRAFIVQYTALWQRRKGGNELDEQVAFSLEAGALKLANNEELVVSYEHLASCGIAVQVGLYEWAYRTPSEGRSLPEFNWFEFLTYLSKSGWKPGDSLAAEQLEMRNGGKWPGSTIKAVSNFP